MDAVFAPHIVAMQKGWFEEAGFTSVDFEQALRLHVVSHGYCDVEDPDNSALIFAPGTTVARAVLMVFAFAYVSGYACVVCSPPPR